MALYENIRTLRLLKGLKQTTLAQALGVSQSTYNRIEQGMQTINDETVEKIAQALGVGEDTLHHLDKHLMFVNNIHSQDKVQNHVYNHGLTPTERQLYEARIAHLEEEVRFLKKIIEERL